MTQVPSTVMGAQVKAHQFPDPFYSKNFRDIPGTDYPLGKIYAYLPMMENSPYRCSWWYRSEFTVPDSFQGERTILRFNGINYRANIWLNGKQIAGDKEIVGAFRSFEINAKVAPGTKNAVAVEIFTQTEHDLGIDFLDWNPAPADKSMGIWRDAWLVNSGSVIVRNPQAVTHFTGDSLKEAALSIYADIANTSDHVVTGLLTAVLKRPGTQNGIAKHRNNNSKPTVSISQPLTLAAGEKRVVEFTSQHFPQLYFTNPQVWWPHTLGKQPLYGLQVNFKINDVVSDAQAIRFGMREASSELTTNRALLFRINRRRILIRGGGWSPDLFYREPRERLQQELRLVQHLGLNTIRLEGKMGTEDLFDLADEMGILIMAGWQCCDHWQQWTKWTPEDHKIAHEALVSQISRLKSHPSVFVWLNGSDEPPPPDVELDDMQVLNAQHWPNAVLSSAAGRVSKVTGESGVKMSGPYDYVPPSYWTSDSDRFGGAFSFNTETSSGAAIPELSSLKKFIPEHHLWPIDDVWLFHAAIGRFAQLNNFNKAMDATYGPAAGVQDYIRKAQAMNYDSERAMFEAYAQRKYTSTGVIQWMLNNAWPSLYWHLYDYYLQPGGGYFGTRKANEPLHVQYSYADHAIYVVNSTLNPVKKLTVTSIAFDHEMRVLDTQSRSIDSPPDSSQKVITLPKDLSLTSTWFLKLRIMDASRHNISDNFYWLAPRPPEFDWEKTDNFLTPTIQHENMRDLAALPVTDVSAKMRILPSSIGGPTGIVKLINHGAALAFQLHLELVSNHPNELGPTALWDDNYISLLPGEERIIQFHLSPNIKPDVALKMAGWNVEAKTVLPSPAH